MDPSDSTGEALVLDNQLCFALYAASRRVIQLYTPLLEPLDLTYTQYVTLMVLWEENRLPVKELGQRLMLDSGTLTPLLKKMEQKGLVTRRRSKEDERSVLVEITEKGRTLKEDAQRFMPELLCSFHLNPRDLVSLRERLKLLLADLDRCEEEAAR
jgi:DNA-binding MarR family transcriptional regulator